MLSPFAQFVVDRCRFVLPLWQFLTAFSEVCSLPHSEIPQVFCSITFKKLHFYHAVCNADAV